MDKNEMMVFSNEVFGDVRVVEKNGEPWFIAADVCKILEIGNVSMAVDRLDSYEKDDISLTDTIGRQQKMLIVNESGLYELMFGSRKKEAKEFKRWVKSEVLPSIRKHGAYMTPDTLLTAIKNPSSLIAILQALQEEHEQRLIIEKQRDAAQIALLEAQPAIEFTEHVQDMEGTVTMDIFARVIQRRGINMGRNKLFAWLRINGYLMKNNQPYQQYVDKYFKSSLAVKHGRLVSYTQVTGQGMLHITKKILKQQGIELHDTRNLMEDIQTAIQGVDSVA